MMTSNRITAQPALNPHCEEQWPRNLGLHPLVADLQEAAYAASAIACLLQADKAITDDLADADDPAGLPRPFSAFAVGGLRAALNVCLSEISLVAERLEKCEVRKRG